MADMLERAIKAALDASIVGIIKSYDDAVLAGDYPESVKQRLRRDSAKNYEQSRREAEPIIRAALLAALDPEDATMMDCVSDAIAQTTGGAPGSYSAAVAAIEALKRMAQGEK